MRCSLLNVMAPAVLILFVGCGEEDLGPDSVSDVKTRTLNCVDEMVELRAGSTKVHPMKWGLKMQQLAQHLHVLSETMRIVEEGTGQQRHAVYEAFYEIARRTRLRPDPPTHLAGDNPPEPIITATDIDELLKQVRAAVGASPNSGKRPPLLESTAKKKGKEVSSVASATA